MQTQTGLNMAKTVLVLFVLLSHLHKTDGSCTFPSALRGTWRSSRWEDITFTSTEVTVTGLTVMGTVTFECETQSGTVYVMRSTSTVSILTVSILTVSILSNAADVLSCLDLRQVSSTKFYYYHATSESPFISGSTEPVMLASPSSTVSSSTVCDISAPYAIGTNHILIKSGYETAAAVQCPNPLLATFPNYTIDKGSGAQCGGVGYINICSNYKNINVDYNVCSETLFYSSGGSVQCVCSSTNGSTHFVNVYNLDSTVDDSTTFRFSCIAVAYGSGGYVYATQYPRTCANVQTDTSVPSTPFVGGVLQMVANVPSAADDGVNVGAIVAAVIIILLIAVVVGFAIYHLGYRKRWPLVKQKVPCLKGRGGQVDSQAQPPEDLELDMDMVDESKPEEQPLGGQPVNMVTTAVVSQDPVKKINSSSSSRSIVTPSKLNPDPSGTDPDQPVPLNPTPRRLPPLNPVDIPGESSRSGHYSSIETPVYFSQARVMALEMAQCSEESDQSSDALGSPPPGLPTLFTSPREPVYENM